MFDLIVRAAQRQPLTAAERATLKALQNFAVGVIATVLVALVTALVQGQALNTALLTSAAVSILYIILNSLQKYLSAKNDDNAAKLIAAGEELMNAKVPVKPLPTTATATVSLSDTPTSSTSTSSASTTSDASTSAEKLSK